VIALVAAGGLVGPATLGMIGFVAARRPRPSRVLLGLLALGLLVAEVLVVRNPFGWLFVGACAAGFGWVAVRCSARTAQTVLVFIAVQLALSGAPDPGVGMASDNDGPVDGPAGSSQQTISTVDRVTVSPVSIAPDPPAKRRV